MLDMLTRQVHIPSIPVSPIYIKEHTLKEAGAEHPALKGHAKITECADMPEIFSSIADAFLLYLC